ncbi:MAG TPA: ABC transporter ATP-binding protein [Candidatus Paceibacterota bacterium]|jgi:lipopolysaccharide transport system ATP-binding protein|nr:ABC transporter ATP-binding protein [Candidatus Paceibacterota bacterium]
MKPAIEVKKLSKKYTISHQKNGGYITLRDSITNFFRFNRKKAITKEQFWALKDINFKVNPGEVLGVIGHNGAGKSTLLKILSQITPPSHGEITIHGSVGSLLEVGTGFHPELTGRENIFLNGAILGMKKKEIIKKFDEIVAFAGIEKFLDTPVKRYSSGMYVRLAFSVAAHMEPDILIIDEVLAVGDIEFQKKCLGKMDEITKKDGRTIVFVSHNMGAVMQLCNRVILLEKGTVVMDGEPQAVIQYYVKSLQTAKSDSISFDALDRKGKGNIQLSGVTFTDEKNAIVANGTSGQQLNVVLNYSSKKTKAMPYPYRIGVAFYDMYGQALFNCSTEVASTDKSDIDLDGTITCVIPQLPLSQGDYSLTFFLEVDGEIEDWVQGALTLPVINGDFFKTGKVSPEGWEGRAVLVPHYWILH